VLKRERGGKDPRGGARGAGGASKGREEAMGTEQEVREGCLSLEVDNGDCTLWRLNREGALSGVGS